MIRILSSHEYKRRTKMNFITANEKFYDRIINETRY